MQNNDWGVSSASQTLNYGPGTKFKVATQGGTGANHAPASYPHLHRHRRCGQHQWQWAPAGGLVDQCHGDLTSWTLSDAGVSGSYNAAYDVWFSTGAGGDSKPPLAKRRLLDGLVLYAQRQPAGRRTIPNGSVTIDGKQFNIWYGTNNGKPVVSYVASELNCSLHGPFRWAHSSRTPPCRTCSGTTKCIVEQLVSRERLRGLRDLEAAAPACRRPTSASPSRRPKAAGRPQGAGRSAWSVREVVLRTARPATS